MTMPVPATRVLHALLLTGVLLASACSSSPDETPSAAQLEASANVQASPPVAAGEGSEDAIGAPGDEGSLEPGDLGTPGGPAGDSEGSGEGASGRGGKKKLPPVELPEKPKVPVEAEVSPTCVERGGVVSLTVKTESEAAVGWQAVYSDGKGGGAPPFGGGYGGNDKGFASKAGDYRSTWIVGADAPIGRGRVDVVIGYAGDWGYDDPHFAVADENGDCPEAWLDEDGNRSE